MFLVENNNETLKQLIKKKNMKQNKKRKNKKNTLYFLINYY